VYGCETWCVALREEHRLKVLQNWVLTEIFGPKRDEVTGEWRKLQNEELYGIRVVETGGVVTLCGMELYCDLS
jgi:hypothetical protein